jgi:hypothetical protein
MINGQEPILKTEEEEFQDSMKIDMKGHGQVEESREQPAPAALRNNFDSDPQAFMIRGMTRSQTLHSLGASSTTSSSSSDPALIQESGGQTHDRFTSFGVDLRNESQGTSQNPAFDKGMRRVMEPYLRKARKTREKSRRETETQVFSPSASRVGVPYTGLRSERPFLFDVDTHPLHKVLAESLGIQELSKMHEGIDLNEVMMPLQSRIGRRKFQESYDNFVTSFCIPLVHSIAMLKNIFHSASPGSPISYRYQAFPNIRIVRPADTSNGPTCDTAIGHNVGCLRFHVPLTPSFGTNALYTESYPGREDWHPLLAKSFGLGFLFDGARCLYFNLENTTNATSVALDFVITFYQDGGNVGYVDGECLCDKTNLGDKFSDAGGYYDEAIIDMGVRSPSWQIVAKKHGNNLLDPDHRVGFPFA